MVAGKLFSEGVKIAVTYGGRFARYDKAAWNKLYTGFPKYVKKGTREGFIAGSSVGGLVKGLISDNVEETYNGQIQPYVKSPPYKFSKARSGFKYNRSRYNKYNPYKSRCRCKHIPVKRRQWRSYR